MFLCPRAETFASVLFPVLSSISGKVDKFPEDIFFSRVAQATLQAVLTSRVACISKYKKIFINLFVEAVII